MRYSLPILLLSLLTACSTAPTEEEGATVPATPKVEVPAKWSGYYEGTLPCADCPGIATQLWVRSDSSFVLQRRYLDRDSMAAGTIAEWIVVDGQLELYDRMQVLRRLSATSIGLEWLDEEGIGHDQVLRRTLDGPQAEIPRMRIKGNFIYMADAMSFQPCGTSRAWPCAGGEQWTDEAEKAGSMGTLELERLYLSSVKQGGDPWTIAAEVTLAMGPAMEGDEEDEYIFIHRVIKGGIACP